MLPCAAMGGLFDDGPGVGRDSTYTRGGFIGRAVGALAPFAFGPTIRFPKATSARTAPLGSLAASVGELAQVRRNVFDLKLAFATRAWNNTRAKADGYLGYQPNPTHPDADLSDWWNAVYAPGLHDGDAAIALAHAYAVGGRSEHGERAKAICLAWARTYSPVPPPSKIGHMVAEPVGPVIKLCMAYDLTKALFSADERAQFASWAGAFVERGKRNADYARDHPWVPDVTYGSDRTNPAPYGNSATWQRAMAVWAAAVVGGATLRETLAWNYAHTTEGGRDYGWDDLLEGLIIDGTGGQLTEDRYRTSIEYGHFSWIPTVLIADLARRAGFRVDLFEYRTKRHGYSVFTPVSYYGQYLMRASVPETLEKGQYGGSAWPKTAARWRAAYEVLYRNARTPATVKPLRKIVNWGGPAQRGDNYDVYILGYAPLFGRGPQGPKPPVIAKKR